MKTIHILLVAALIAGGTFLVTRAEETPFFTPTTSNELRRQITLTLSGSGSVIPTGQQDLGLKLEYPIRFDSWAIMSYPKESTASLKCDIWVQDFGTFPTASDTVVGSSTPTLTSMHMSSGTFSVPFTVAAGQLVDASVLSVAVSTKAVVILGGEVVR